MAMFKKYMQAIYTAPGTLLISNNNHRNQSNQTDLADINRYVVVSVISTLQPFQPTPLITSFTSIRLYFVVFIKAQGQKQ